MTHFHNLGRRAADRRASNNPHDTNRNLCSLAIAELFGVQQKVRYLHTVQDLVRALRTTYVVRSRMGALRGGVNTVESLRRRIGKLKAEFFLIYVDGHVLVLDRSGKTVVDTAPRRCDSRVVRRFYGIFARGAAVR